MFRNFQNTSSSFSDRLYPRTDVSRVGTLPIPQPATIVTDGLRLYLDAGNASSYPGSGTTWTDISGYGNNFTLVNGPTFTTESGGAIVFDGTNDYATGPNANLYGITADATIELIIKPTQAVTGASFRFQSNENIRGLFAHTPYSDNTYYYDSAGQRIQFTDATLINQNAYFVFRRRAATSPYREIIRNSVQRAADTNALNAMTLNANPVLLAAVPADAEYFKGNMYVFRVYNRALSDAELAQNYSVDRARFGL
jgi:hypothetical protein